MRLLIMCVQAFTPVITMLALFIARLEEPSSRLIVAVVLIALGTAMASYGEVNMSTLGLTFMFASETFEAHKARHDPDPACWAEVPSK